MSTSEPQTPAPAGQSGEPGRQPTQEDILAIATAAAAGLEDVRTEQEATRRIAENAQRAATERGVSIPEEVIKQISEQTAQVTIGQLRAMGALRDDPPPEASAATPTGQDGGGEGQPATGSEGEASPERKRTLAERYLGI